MRLDPFPLSNVVQKTVNFSLMTKNRLFTTLYRGKWGKMVSECPNYFDRHCSCLKKKKTNSPDYIRKCINTLSSFWIVGFCSKVIFIYFAIRRPLNNEYFWPGREKYNKLCFLIKLDQKVSKRFEKTDVPVYNRSFVRVSFKTVAKQRKKKGYVPETVLKLFDIYILMHMKRNNLSYQLSRITEQFIVHRHFRGE